MSALARWRVVAVVALWYSLASVTGICSPEILSALIKPAPHGLGLSIAGAGLLLTVEMIANGSFSLAARLFDRCSSRTLLVSGFLATFAADIATTEAKGFGVLVALRAVAGAGLGVATVAVSRFIASSENPDRFSSVLLVISTTLSGSVLVVFGNSSPPVAAIFGILAGLVALGLGTAVLSAGAHVRNTVAENAGQADATRWVAVFPSLLLIAASGLLNTADNGLYALTSVVGEHAGVGEELLGYILTGAMVAGVVAALSAGWLRSSTSRSRGLLASMVTKACVALALVRVTNASGFGAMVTISSFMQFLAIPLLLGGSAHIDRRGRVAAQVYGAIQIGGALGPAWASGLDELLGLRTVATVCAVLFVISACLCLAPLRLVRGLDLGLPSARGS